MRELLIDGIPIPREAGLEITQSYDWDEPVSETRMVDGAARQQQSYAAKLVTTVRGRNGLMPVGLSDLDYSQPMLLSCIRLMGATSTSRLIAITPNRRSDPGSDPIGFARVGRTWVPTPCAMAGDIAQLDAVAGATLYQVKWLPEFLAYIRRPREDGSVGRPFEWSFTAREK